MTKKDLADVALKIVGVYMLILSLDSLILLIKSMKYFIHIRLELADEYEELLYLIANSFGTTLYAVGFVLLTLKTSLVTNRLIKSDSDTVIFSINKTDMLEVLFIAAGIIILFFSISECWSQVLMGTIWWWNSDDFGEGRYRTAVFFIQIGVPLSKAFLGLSFILFSGRLVRLLMKLKGV